MMLLDAVGSSDIGDDTLATLAAGGCQVAWYNPLHWKTIGRYNNRTHRKSLIVDGTIAFTGGAGIADHWRGDARGPGEWRDIQIRLEGPAVDAAAIRVRAQLAADHGRAGERRDRLPGGRGARTACPAGAS